MGLFCNSAAGDDSVYKQHNLVSDLGGMADHTDLSLVNAWGIEHSPTSPWWVNSNGKGLSIVYDATGAPAPPPPKGPIVVSIPLYGSGTPTGIVFNPTMDFQIASMQPAFFLFSTEDGIIAGWNPSVNASQAILKVNLGPGAVYKGITLGTMRGANVIYVANFRGGTVDVFDTHFSAVPLPSGAFKDANVPAGFAPFNVQNIDGSIFVTFAKQDDAKHDDEKGPGNGYVDRFTPEGVLVTRFEHGSWMNSPWGVVASPGNFGKLSEKLLVGNFGSGQIAAFNRETGKFQSMMIGTNGSPVTIDGLWGLKFGNGFSAGPANVLFFAAGIQGENHGLFGSLKPNGGEDESENQNGQDNH
jgi:uncharacterized protein (TIGR03118 family)